MNKTPKLRFKEFSGDWESKKLGTMGEFFKGSTLSKANLTEEGRPCILYGELYTKYGEVIKKAISKTNLDDSKLVIGQKNDVLIPSSGETAIDIATASCLQQEDVILGGDLNVFRSDKLNGVFASYQLNNSKKLEIAKLAQGASVVHVYNNQLTKLKLSVPSKEEQEKIASFFSLIDDKISLQGEKVEALKDYKRGMMQKIFSRELRFKDDDGRDYPEWEEKSFEELYSSISTKSYQIKSSEVESGGEFEVVDQGKENVCGYTDNQEKVFYDIPIIIYGDHTTNIKFRDEKFVIGADGTKLLCNKNNSNDMKFLFFALEFNNIEPEGYKRHFSILKQISLYIPASKKEQIKISTVLSSLDSKIDREQEKLDSLNEYKKALLQQMFV